MSRRFGKYRIVSSHQIAVAEHGRSIYGPPPAERAALAAEPGSPLAQARQAAHAAFDPVWQQGLRSRRDAYCWLAIQMGVRSSDCHMVLLNLAQCEQVVAICKADPLCRRAQQMADPINDF